MDLILLTQGKEWDRLWDWLSVHPFNQGVEDPTVALHGMDAWRYMGTYRQGDRYVHCLRHLNHPLTNSVKELYLSASDDFDPNEIAKTFKLK